MSSNNGCNCGWKNFCWNILCDENEGKLKAAYGYVYLLKEDTEIDIPVGDAIPFNRNGILKGITHDVNNNRETIIIEETGIYEVTYYFDNNAKEILDLELNGAPVAGSRYGAETGASIDYGQVIIKVEKNNSTLKLINRNKNRTIKIAKLNPADDPEVVVSSIFIEKIDEI